ncbi:MAG: hypothetical protein DMF24_02745 [Verrucomicrobia bacterium]|nr:MAG: hypothetical protein DMF24_02745 [Verrucomicrobiota bacterium]
MGTAAAFKFDSIIEGRESIEAADSAQDFQPCANLNSTGDKTTERGIKMKKLLFIALVATGLLLVPIQRSDAQITVGVGGVGVGYGYGYPAYGYGYYPYGYYRPYPYYGYYNGPTYYWYNGNRYYRHHRHHYYHQY